MSNTKIKNDCLVGKYFHSIDENGEMMWQGKIEGSPSDSLYLIQLFSWLDGCATEQKMVKLEDMIDWLFYDNHDDFVDSYNHGTASKLCKIKNP